MCIIVYKPKEIAVDDEFMANMEKCFNENSDGAGYMWSDANKVHIRKGFMTWGALKKELKKFAGKNIGLVLHFRLATHGTIDRYTCHPFPISRKNKDLRSVRIECDAGIAHNGVIHFCIPPKNSVLSDTQVFVKNYLSKFDLDTLSNPAFGELIEEATSSKFALMFPDKVMLIGNFIKDKGVYYSNESYKGAIKYFFKDWTYGIGKYAGGYGYVTCDLCGYSYGKLHNVIDYATNEKIQICEICFKDFYFKCNVCSEILPIEYEHEEEDEICVFCYNALNKS